MANLAFNKGLATLPVHDWASDTIDIGVMLVTSSYTFDPDDNTIADLVADETSGTGYGRRAIAAAARSVNEDDAGDAANLRVTDGTVTWTNINAGTGLSLITFFVTGTGLSDNANLLYGFYDTGTLLPINTNGGTIALNFNQLGAIRLRNG